MRFLIFVLFLSCFTNYGTADIYEENINEILKKLREFDLEQFYGNSTLCSKHLMHLLEGRDMIDSTSKLQSGILFGNLINLGEYDQCLGAKHNTTDGIMRGQYCTFTFSFYVNRTEKEIIQMDGMHLLKKAAARVISKKIREEELNRNYALQMQMALCVPDSCNETDIFEPIKSLVNQTDLPIAINDGYCIKHEMIPYSTGDIIAIIIFSIFGLLTCASTFYDVFKVFTIKHPLLSAFSFYTNGGRLLAIRPTSKNGNEITCVHGLRALSICWVVLGHRFLSSILSPNINSVYFTMWIKKYYSTYITGATVSVDSFFVMSGMLVTYIFLDHMEKGHKFNPLTFYLHRYLRLTPALAAIVLLEATLLIRFSDGPLWIPGMIHTKETCQKYWWSALLYIQNYYNPSEICVAQSWYLSVDTQLFALSPLILLPLWKWPKKTLGVIAALMFISVAILIAISYINGYPRGMFDPEDPTIQSFTEVYVPTHTRFGPWLVGVMLGYYLYKCKSNPVRINKFLVLGIWLVVLLSAGAIVTGAYQFYQLEANSTLAQNVSYLSLHRFAWAICVAWVIFACHKGYGGPINWFLSWGFWQPISRLSYSLYLIHLPLQMVLTLSTRTNTNFTDFGVMQGFAIDITLGLAISVVWCLTFESPILAIEKHLLHYEKDKTETDGLICNTESARNNEAFSN